MTISFLLGMSFLSIINGAVIYYCVGFHHDKVKEIKESEIEQLNTLYMSELDSINNKKEEAERERKKVVNFINGIKECCKVRLGEKIDVMKDGYILCDLQGNFNHFTVFHVEKGAKIIIMKRESLVRHGVNIYQCIYVDPVPGLATEDHYIDYPIKPKGLNSKIKFHIAEEEILRIKMISLIYSLNIKIEGKKLEKILGISERAT